MESKRIHKDINITWPILTNGEAISLDGRDLKLILKDPKGCKIELPFTFSDNILTTTFYGKDHKHLGVYQLTLWENFNKVGMTAVDCTKAFKLVANTDQETSTFDGGDTPGGGGGVVINIDNQLSPTSENPVQNKAIYGALTEKQDKLTPGQNITIDENNVISASGGGGSVEVDEELNGTSTNPVENKAITEALAGKQNTLVSGTNIRTINGEPILGSGDITVTEEGVVPTYTVRLKGTDTEVSTYDSYDSYIPISGVVTTAAKRPTVSSTTGYSDLPSLLNHYGIDQTVSPDFILDMVSTSSPFFYIAYYSVSMFELTTYYFEVTSNSLFSSFTDYIPGNSSKVYCKVFGGIKEFYVWDGNEMTAKPSSNKIIKYLDGSTIMQQANTIYEIVEDIDLGGTQIVPAAGSIIKYGGGKLKNGTINGRNGIWVDCPDIVLFENMQFVKMAGSQVFKDTWFANVFNEGSLKGISRISLSKDYVLSADAVGVDTTETVSGGALYYPLTIYGNGHTLTLPSQVRRKYNVPTTQFIQSYYIDVRDLNIVFADTDPCKMQLVFDTNIGIFNNVKFNGLCRFAGAYSNPSPNTTIVTQFGMYPQLQFYGCDIRVPKFAVEGPFNIAIAKDSIFARSSHEYLDNTMFSISPYGLNEEFVENSYINFENCYLEGGWETPNHGRRKWNSTNEEYDYYYSYSESSPYYYRNPDYTNHITYNKVKFKKCELLFPFMGVEEGFAQTNDNHSGTTVIAEYEDCNIYTNFPKGRFYTDSLVFRRCNINLMYNPNRVTPAYPFILIKPSGKLEFTDCKFDCGEYTSISGRHWEACNSNGLVDASDGQYTHYVLLITEYPSDEFKVILKNNIFVEGQYKNKIDIYCDAPTGGSLADRVECAGNKYILSKPRLLENGYRTYTNPNRSIYSSAYGRVTEGFWSNPSTRSICILPIEHTAFRGSEAITSSPFSFDACVHDFDYSVGNIYDTSVQTSYYIYDALRSTSRKIQFE